MRSGMENSKSSASQKSSEIVHIGPSEELVEYLSGDRPKKAWLLKLVGAVVIAVLVAIGVTLERVREYAASIAFLLTAALLLLVIHGVRKVVNRQKRETERRIEQERQSSLERAKEELKEEAREIGRKREEFEEWLNIRAEDELLKTADSRLHVSDGAFKLINETTLQVSLSLFNNTGGPVTIQGLELSWTAPISGAKMIRLPIVPGEFALAASQDFSETFEMVRVFKSKSFPSNTWVRFAFTRHRTKWRTWSQLEPFSFDSDSP
jgi:hypothetical protein